MLCYGLRTDFQGNLFPGSAALLALADALIELKAVCECGRKATMNLRVDAEGHAVAAGAQTEIGGNDRYVALCRRHFFERLRESEARQLTLGHPRWRLVIGASHRQALVGARWDWQRLIAALPPDFVLTLVDVGSAGGLHKRWRAVPADPLGDVVRSARSGCRAGELGRGQTRVYPVALSDAPGEARALHHRARPTCRPSFGPTAEVFGRYRKKGRDAEVVATEKVPVERARCAWPAPTASGRDGAQGRYAGQRAAGADRAPRKRSNSVRAGRNRGVLLRALMPASPC